LPLDKTYLLGYKVNDICYILTMTLIDDLSLFETGQISASFTSLQRSIDDYDNLAKREMVAVKKETAVT
jgi:hypothetical protein